MIVAVAAGLIGVILIGHGVRFWLKGQASLAWPEIAATPSTAVVLHDATHDLPTYRASVRYSYRYDGVTYEGDTAFFGDRLWVPFSGHLRGRTAVLEVDHEVVVRVNPNRPAESVVDPGIHWHAYAAALAGLGFIIWGMVLVP